MLTFHIPVDKLQSLCQYIDVEYWKTLLNTFDSAMVGEQGWYYVDVDLCCFLCILLVVYCVFIDLNKVYFLASENSCL